MKLKDYTDTHTQISLAKLIGIAPSFVNQWVKGSRPVPITACVVIESVTNGAVTRQELRPDDFQKIWPELAQAPVAIAQAATETVAVDATTAEVGSLRSGGARRHARRRAQDLPIDLDRRAKAGPPFQALESGVA